MAKESKCRLYALKLYTLSAEDITKLKHRGPSGSIFWDTNLEKTKDVFRTSELEYL